MFSSIQIQIESLNDLQLFAKLHDIDESQESLKKLWQERPGLIKVESRSGNIIATAMGYQLFLNHMRDEIAVEEMRGYL